ncbi:MAG: hypothetical protein HAW58_05435, partial [Candidatus Thioglobus sp.]|nr:hypothetical protein [Candidatus Thioglobus sp.]
VDAVEAAAGTPTAVTLSENDPAGTVVVSAAAAKSYFINVDKSVLTYTLAGDNRNAFAIAAATGEITAFQQFNDGQVGDYTLTITATDAAGSTATVSVAVEITNVNDVPVGLPRITGHVVIGQTITANTDDIRDEDGLGTFLYVWRKNGDNIAGATNATLELTDANVSLRDQITVTIAYTDSGSNIESLTSASIRVSAGSVVITSANSVIVGSTVALTADTFPVANGIIAWTISGSGTDIASINGSTLTGVAPGVVTLIAVDFASTVLSTQEFTVFPVPITSITITNAASVGIGETVELTATVLPSAANQTPIWSIQGSANVATLNGTTLTAIAAGTVIVFATADDGSDSPEVATQTFSVTLPGPTTLGAVATGAPHQVLIFWDEVAGATNYKIYQTSADLSAFAGGTAANLSTANPAPASPAETSETNIALNLTGSATVHFLVTAVANGVESSTSAEEVTATGHSLNFTAIDGVGSSVWTDRNLGATIRQESTGGVEDAVGDLYQWGRPADGHQLRNSNNTGARATTISPGHANFITSSSRPDWLDPTSQATVDARAEFWKTLDGSGICPTGFRVPSIAELEAERVSWSSNNRAGAVAAGLRWVPRTDQRSGVNGTAPRSTGSFYWSTDNVSDGVNITGQYLETTQFDAETSDGSFDTGLAVRCIRDSAITISSAEVISFAPPNKQAFINSYSQMFFRLVAVSEATYEIVKSDSKVRARQKLFDFTYQRISNTEARIVVNASVFTDEDFSYEYRLIFATFDTGRVEVYQGTGADPTGFTLADDETNSFFTLTFR